MLRSTPQATRPKTEPKTEPKTQPKTPRAVTTKRSLLKTKPLRLKPHSTFSTSTTEATNQTHDEQHDSVSNPTLRAALSKDPAVRFSARNKYIQRRHLERDHLIHTHHNDVRIFACNLTETLRTAVKKHNMSLLEAETWGGYAAGTALYAGTLRGNDRVIFEAFLNNKQDQTNHLYVEAFAVGEIRGFSSIKTPDVDPTDGYTHPGTGVVRLTKALYQHRRKFQSTLPSTGDPMKDWQFVYSQSEQIPTYVQTETLVSQDPETGEVIVDFCGASLVQVLGGDAVGSERVRILAAKKLKRLEDETDDQYVKRVQLHEYSERVIDEDMPTIVKKYGSLGYVSTLIGINPETLGKPAGIQNVGNVDHVFDWELFERSVLQSALREKPLTNVINTETGSEVTELSLQQDGKFQYQFEYRPLQFFCRCYQTDSHGKLMSLPKDVLTSLLQDEIVTFTCDFCATEDEIQRTQVQNAIAEKDEMEKQLLEQQTHDQQPALADATPTPELQSKGGAVVH
jgi:redox-regulated HSP33 family molecular chaperone